MFFANDVRSVLAFLRLSWMLLAEIWIPSVLSVQSPSLSTIPGSASNRRLSCFTSTGTMSTTSATTSTTIPSRIRKVASPRRHPRSASQLTAGSSANERNSEVINQMMRPLSRTMIARRKDTPTCAASAINTTRKIQRHGVPSRLTMLARRVL
jgi:hypothetical protein